MKITLDQFYSAHRYREKMKLLIFDIDGTLTKTNKVDTYCYKQAITSILGNITFRISWAKYKNVTDEGILFEIAEDNGLKISQETRTSIKEQFLRLLTAEFNRDQPKEIPGGIALINDLIQSRTPFSFATGCWRESALLKLSRAGYIINPILVSSSDDAIAREEIMLHSLEKAKKHYKFSTTLEVCYFGDGSYDFHASKNLGWQFIGIGNNVKEICQSSGSIWLDDFSGEFAIKNL